MANPITVAAQKEQKEMTGVPGSLESQNNSLSAKDTLLDETFIAPARTAREKMQNIIE